MVSKFDNKIATFAARTKNTIILHYNIHYCNTAVSKYII
jgi:hypothetical protein